MLGVRLTQFCPLVRPREGEKGKRERVAKRERWREGESSLLHGAGIEAEPLFRNEIDASGPIFLKSFK